MKNKQNYQLTKNNSNQDLIRETPFSVRFVSGLLGSTISSLICSPLDLIKVRYQVSVLSINISSSKESRIIILFLMQ